MSYNSFAWEAPRILQAQIVIGAIDEDALVDALADLVWSMRHSVNHKSIEQE